MESVRATAWHLLRSQLGSVFACDANDGYLSRLVPKPTKWHVCPAKTQISVGIRPV